MVSNGPRQRQPWRGFAAISQSASGNPSEPGRNPSERGWNPRHQCFHTSSELLYNEVARPWVRLLELRHRHDICRGHCHAHSTPPVVQNSDIHAATTTAPVPTTAFAVPVSSPSVSLHHALVPTLGLLVFLTAALVPTTAPLVSLIDPLVSLTTQ